MSLPATLHSDTADGDDGAVLPLFGGALPTLRQGGPLLLPGHYAYVVDHISGQVLEASRLGELGLPLQKGIGPEEILNLPHADDRDTVQQLDAALMRLFYKLIDGEHTQALFRNVFCIDYKLEGLPGAPQRVLRTSYFAGYKPEINQLVGVAILRDFTAHKRGGMPGHACHGPDAGMLNELLAKEMGRPRLPAKSPLSKRETDVVRCLKDGLASKMIAHKLHIALETVGKHRANILKKLQLSNTAEVVAKALDNNWI